MIKRLYAFGIIGTDAATQEEGSVAGVGRENAPVEFLAIATYALAFSVEQQIVDYAFVLLGICKIGCCGDVEGLNN